MAECPECGAEDISVTHCHECGHGIDKEQIRASWHRDGHWDMSMSKIRGEKLSWTDSAEIQVSNGTVRIDSNGKVIIDGNFSISYINES
jgi:methionyl-tRNA synthetase